MAPFKFDSHLFYLTYSQCGDTTWEAIRDVIASKQKILWARFGHEQHQDGGWHWHVTGEWEKRVQSRDCRFLDVAGFHPNVQRTRKISACIDYVTKHGEFVDIGTVPTDGDTDVVSWVDEARRLSNSEYFELALAARISYQYAKHFWDLVRAEEQCTITEAYVADISRECIECMCLLPDEQKSTVVVGPAGCGKTSWAKRVSEKPALWVRHLDMLRSFRRGYHKSIIFDDMEFGHLPVATQKYLTDWSDECHIHCRYGVAVIPAGVQKLFTANVYPFVVDAAIERRVHRVDIIGFRDL